MNKNRDKVKVFIHDNHLAMGAPEIGSGRLVPVPAVTERLVLVHRYTSPSANNCFSYNYR